MKKIISVFVVFAIIFTQTALFTSVNAADNISSDGSYTFAYEFVENGDDDYIKITGFSVYPDAEYILTIPATAEYNGVTYPVRAIADDAFASGCTSSSAAVVTYSKSAYNDLLTGVVFEGANLQSIGANAFTFCSNTNFTDLTIPDNVTTLGKAFYYCTRLERLTFGEGITSIPYGTVTQCNVLETLTIKADNFTFEKVGSIYVTKGMKNIVLECDTLAIPGPLLLFATKTDEALSSCEGTGFSFKVKNTSVYDTLVSAGYTSDYVILDLSDDGGDSGTDLELDAEKVFYESKWRFDAWTEGGLDIVDTLQYARKDKKATVTVDNEALASTAVTYLPDYVSDATSDLIYNKQFAFANNGEKVTLDINFNSAYTGSRKLDNLLIMLNRADDSNKNGSYTVELAYSTTADADTFSNVYNDSIDVTQDYAYFIAENIANISDVDTLRISITYSGGTFSVCEIDVNMKNDPYVDKRTTYNTEIKPVKVISDGMVMQRNVKNAVWGTGGIEGEALTVKIANQTKTTTVTDGKWSVEIDPVAAGGPYTMEITCGTLSKTISDIWFGEVWLASGQSNMARSFETLLGEIDGRDVYYNIDKTKLKKKIQRAVDNASDENTRFFTVSTTATSKPYYTVRSNDDWQILNSTTAVDMSAVCYYFAEEMRTKFGENMPIGIVIAPVPGSPLQGWVSNELIASDSDYSKYVTNWTNSMYYNSMIYPLADYNFKGILWYQGESNVSDRVNHKKLFPQMVELWRNLFGDSDMPFIFTQLAPYISDVNYSRELFREVQLDTMLNVPNTAMAVITDSGDPYNIHPMDKSQVGLRLAKAAWALAYGGTGEYSGPLYRSMRVSGNKLIISFDHIGSGLTIGTDWGEDVGLIIGGDTLEGFEISGDGINFVDADAVISGNTVVVSADGIDSPVAVRYGWNIDRETVNGTIVRDTEIPTLYNKEGLPAVPFRAFADGFAFAVEYTDGDSATVKIDYANNNTINSVFLVAVYYNGKLVNLKSLPAKFDYDGASFSTTYNVDLSSYSDKSKINVKVFAFDGLRSVKPLAEAWSMK